MGKQAKSIDQNLGKQPGRISEAAAQATRDQIIGRAPPRNDSRFKKGQSGNPKGRPSTDRGAPAPPDFPGLNELFLKQADKTMQVREDGVSKEISADEIVIKATFKSAAQGSPLAQRTWLNWSEKAKRYKQAKINTSNDFWRMYKATAYTQVEEAIARGGSEPEFLPHPDDVILRDGKDVEIIGPFDEKELEEVQRTIRLRDVMLLQSELDNRAQVHLPVQERSASYVIFCFLNQHTPPRFRLPEQEINCRIWSYWRLTKRELLKIIHREFKALGLPVKRGQKFIKISDFVSWTKLILQIRKAHQTDEIDFTRMRDPSYQAEFKAWAERAIEGDHDLD